jgi:hypothetical protein
MPLEDPDKSETKYAKNMSKSCDVYSSDENRETNTQTGSNTADSKLP